MAGDHDERDPFLVRMMHENIAGSKFVILPKLQSLGILKTNRSSGSRRFEIL
jgi:hypothetical protein